MIINDPKLVSSYALKIGAAIAIVGPENPLAMGVADALWAMGTKVVGPKKKSSPNRDLKKLRPRSSNRI